MLRTLVITVIATGLAVSVNVATDNVDEPLAWVATAVLTVLAAFGARPTTDRPSSAVSVFGRRNKVRQRSASRQTQTTTVVGSDNKVDQR